MKKLYIEYFSKRFFELLILSLVVLIYRYVFITFFGLPALWSVVFLLPIACYLFFIIYRVIDARRFAKYIEKHNDLREYLVSFVELRENSDNEFLDLIKKHLFSELKSHNVRIPLNITLLKSILLSIIFLEVFVIGYTLIFVPRNRIVRFDKVEYYAFPGEKITLSLYGNYLPESIYVLSPEYGKMSVPVNGRTVSFKVPQNAGRFVLNCRFCVPARLRVIKKPFVKAEGYVLMSTGKRKLLPLDYVLSSSSIKIKFSLFNADSAIIYFAGKKLPVRSDTTVRFVIKHSDRLRAVLFGKGKTRDTTLYRIFVVKDMPPRVLILYPPKSIIPVMEDTVRVVAYTYDDIGLDRAFVLVYRGGQKTLIHEKQYKDRLSDTLRFAIFDILRGYHEVKLRIVVVDVSGKEGFVELTYREPSYKERLEEFMAIGDSIRAQGNDLIDEKELENFDFSLKEHRDLNLEEREKLKITLEKAFKSIEEVERHLDEVNRMVENLKELSQDKDLIRTMEEFNKTFSEILKEHFRDILKKIAEAKGGIDTLNQKDLAKSIEQIKSQREEIIKELKKLREFMELARKELDREEFISRFNNLIENEKYLKDKTEYFKNIKPLKKEQMDIIQNLDSLHNTSPELWKKYQNELKAIKKQMKTIARELKNGNKREALEEERKVLNSMEELAGNLKEDLRKYRENRKRASLEKIKKIKNELYFINLSVKPNMDLHTRGLYKESIKEVLSYTDSLDAMTYVIIFKSIALLRLACGFADNRPILAYGFVNQAIYHLLHKQIGMKRNGAKGAAQQLRDMLKKLLSQQSSLTNKTKGLLPIPVPTSEGLKSILQEYGRMQEKLRRMAEKLAKLAEDQKTKGEIARALSEMKAAENELKRGYLSQKTVEHQRKALRHLLNAYRSVRKKDISRKRVSTPGKSFVPDIPSVPQELIISEKLEQLQRELELKGAYSDSFFKDYINRLHKLE